MVRTIFEVIDGTRVTSPSGMVDSWAITKAGKYVTDGGRKSALVTEARKLARRHHARGEGPSRLIVYRGNCTVQLKQDYG